MVWVAVSCRWKQVPTSRDKSMNPQECSKVLSDYSVPFYESYGTPPEFQHDSTPWYVAKNTSEWLELSKIPVIKWLERSADLNTIENLHSALAAKVYEGTRQFDYLNDLKKAETAACDSITFYEVQKLFTSMPRRCIACVKEKRFPTGY